MTKISLKSELEKIFCECRNSRTLKNTLWHDLQLWFFLPRLDWTNNKAESYASLFSLDVWLIFFDRLTCSKQFKESFFSVKKTQLSSAIYSILVYFIMFSFQVLTCLRIVSIRIILNLNKFRQVWTCSDMFENHMSHYNSYHIESEQV